MALPIFIGMTQACLLFPEKNLQGLRFSKTWNTNPIFLITKHGGVSLHCGIRFHSFTTLLAVGQVLFARLPAPGFYSSWPDSFTTQYWDRCSY